MKRKVSIGILSILSFAISTNIYTDLRGYEQGLFSWGNLIFPIDLTLIGDTLSSNSFILYNLPDGLWMLSLLLLFMMIWGSRASVLPWLFLGLIMAISLEAFQYYGYIKGTYDLLDVITYILVFVFTLMIYKILKSNKWNIGNYTFSHF